MLNGGIDEAAQRRMENLKHELMKLKEAEQEQGQEHKRESQSNRKSFSNDAKQFKRKPRIILILKNF